MKNNINKTILIIHIIACYLFGLNNFAVDYAPTPKDLLSNIPGLIICNVFCLLGPLVMTYIVYFYMLRHSQLSKLTFWILVILDVTTGFYAAFIGSLALKNPSAYILKFYILLAYYLIILATRIIVGISTYKKL